jgi:serine protease inhibitor
LVLTNAVHFKADWGIQFLSRHTEKELFHVTPTQEVAVDMMHMEKYLMYKHSTLLGAKVLELPYKVYILINFTSYDLTQILFLKV